MFAALQPPGGKVPVVRLSVLQSSFPSGRAAVEYDTRVMSTTSYGYPYTLKSQKLMDYDFWSANCLFEEIVILAGDEIIVIEPQILMIGYLLSAHFLAGVVIDHDLCAVGIIHDQRRHS